MRMLPPLKYKAAERLRFGGSLIRSSPEIEPCGGYSRGAQNPPRPVKIGAQLGLGEQVAIQTAVRGRFALNPPLPPPTFSPVATVWPLLGGRQPLLLLRIRSDTPARGATIPLGLVTLRSSFSSRGRGVGSVCRSLPGQPGPPAAKKGATCPPCCVWCDPGSPGGQSHPGHPGCTRGPRIFPVLASSAWCNPGSPGG